MSGDGDRKKEKAGGLCGIEKGSDWHKVQEIGNVIMQKKIREKERGIRYD